MTQPEETSRQACSDKKLPWERPTVTFAGNIADLVRAGTASGKAEGIGDGASHDAKVPKHVVG